MFINRSNVQEYAQRKPRRKSQEPQQATFSVRLPIAQTHTGVISRRSIERSSSPEGLRRWPGGADSASSGSSSPEEAPDLYRPREYSYHVRNGFQNNRGHEGGILLQSRALQAAQLGGIDDMTPLAAVSPGASHMESYSERQPALLRDDSSQLTSSAYGAVSDGNGRRSTVPRPGIYGDVQHSARRSPTRESDSVDRSGSSPFQAASSIAREYNSGISHMVSVSALGQTLAAATKALAAAAEREGQRRALDVAAASISQTSVPLDAVVHLLLQSAQAEKAMLFDSYLSTTTTLREALLLCAVAARRDAQRTRSREADQQRQHQHSLLQKVAAYRQHIAEESARDAAAEAQAEELRAAEATAAQLSMTVRALSDKVTVQEAALVQQQRVFDAETQQRRQELCECAMELRALQRAHGQATERWLTMQVLHKDLEAQLAALKKKRKKPAGALLSREEHSEKVCLVARAQKAYGSDDRNAQRGVYGSMEGTGEAFTPLRLAGSLAPPLATTQAAPAAAQQTALEALLARTTSDSGTLPSLPPQRREELAGDCVTDGNAPRDATVVTAAAAASRPPPSFGGLSSPPDTPLLTSALQGSSESRAANGVSKEQGRSPGAEREQEGTKGESAVGAGSREGSHRDASSSSRPSRLNSVASTRRRSSSPLESGDGDPMLRLSEPARPVASLARVDEVVVMRTEPHDDRERLQLIASEVVSAELSRLLSFAAPRCSSASRNTKRPSLADMDAALLHGRPPPPPQPAQSDAVQFFSSPRLGGSERLSSATGAAQPGCGSSDVVTLSALQWMRVCETAQLAAQVNSQLLGKLQELCDTLTRRVKLLEDKDWNKTMAKQFIATDHAAALRRLTAQVAKILHGVSFSVESSKV